MWDKIITFILAVGLLALAGFLLWKLVTKVIWPLLKIWVWFFPASICICCWFTGNIWIGILATAIMVGVYILMFRLKNRNG